MTPKRKERLLLAQTDSVKMTWWLNWNLRSTLRRSLLLSSLPNGRVCIFKGVFGTFYQESWCIQGLMQSARIINTRGSSGGLFLGTQHIGTGAEMGVTDNRNEQEKWTLLKTYIPPDVGRCFVLFFSSLHLKTLLQPVMNSDVPGQQSQLLRKNIAYCPCRTQHGAREQQWSHWSQWWNKLQINISRVGRGQKHDLHLLVFLVTKNDKNFS